MDNPQCVQCGGKEYVLQDGFYFCRECNVQSQDIQERVFDSFFASQMVIPDTNVHEFQSQEVYSQDRKEETEVTSWEVFNYILKGLVDEMILIGAPKELKIVTLQIWCTYLQQLQVAFISKKIKAKPRLGIAFRRRDAELIYELKDDKSHTYKYLTKTKKLSKRSRKSSRSSISTDISAANSLRRERYRLTMSKRELAKAEYKETQHESSQNLMATTLESLGESQSQTSERSFKISYSKHGKSKLNKLVDSAKTAGLKEMIDIKKRLLVREAISLRHPKLSQIVAILKTALNVLQQDIHFGDILRWSEEGYLSLKNAERLLPPNLTLNKDNKHIFNQIITSNINLEGYTYDMGKFVKAEINPPFKTLIQRYLIELDLPDDLEILIDDLLSRVNTKLPFINNLNMEGKAMGFIIFSLKLLFGLDDITERNQSNFADLINNDPEAKGEEGEQFSWDKWTRFIVSRQAHIARIHLPTNYKCYRAGYNGGLDIFLSQWDNSKMKYSFSRRENIDDNIKNTVKRLLRDFVCPLKEPKTKPSKTPYSSYYKLTKGPKLSFKNKSLSYLLKPDFRERMLDKFNLKSSNNLNQQFITALSSNVEPPKLYKTSKVKHVKLNIIETESIHLFDDDEEDNGYEETSQTNDCIYLPGGSYWLFDKKLCARRLAQNNFDESAPNIFPASFFWLLNECAMMINQGTHNVYKELVKIEKAFLVTDISENDIIPWP